MKHICLKMIKFASFECNFAAFLSPCKESKHFGILIILLLVYTVSIGIMRKSI